MENFGQMPGPLVPDEWDHLIAVARRPRTADTAAIDSLQTILAQQRRLEDIVGSAPLLPAIAAQLAVVESLVIGARGPIRRRLVRVAAQWAQFCGWLHASTCDEAAGRRWYSRALEWATEADDPDMVATALSMTGHLEWMAGNPGPMVGLSQAAGRQPASPGVRALAAQQEARAHAILGEADDVDRLLDTALELAGSAAEHPDKEPPWVYFHSPSYLTMQRGLAYRYLGRYDEAIDLLRTGLDSIAPQLRRSEWCAAYVYQLTCAFASLGDRESALTELIEVDQIAAATSSARLAGLSAALRQRLEQ